MCNREAPSVEEAAQQWTDEVVFVGVAGTGTDDEYLEFVDRHGLTFPQIADPQGYVFDRFQISGTPAMALVRTDGQVEVLVGAADAEFIDSWFDDSLS